MREDPSIGQECQNRLGWFGQKSPYYHHYPLSTGFNRFYGLEVSGFEPDGLVLTLGSEI
jgi:hypothetical protein